MKLLSKDQKTTLLETIKMRKDSIESVAYISDSMIELKHKLQDLWDYVKELPVQGEPGLLQPTITMVNEVKFAVMDKIGEVEKLQPYKWEDHLPSKTIILKQLVTLRRASRWLMQLALEVGEEEEEEEFTV